MWFKLYLTPKRYHYKQNTINYQLLFRKGGFLASRPDSKEWQKSNLNMEIKAGFSPWKILKQLKILAFHHENSKWDYNSWFTAIRKRLSILELFFWEYPSPTGDIVACLWITCFNFFLHLDQRTGESIFTQSNRRCKEKEKCWIERTDLSTQGIYMSYWPSFRLGWLDIDHILLLHVYRSELGSINKQNMNKAYV